MLVYCQAIPGTLYYFCSVYLSSFHLTSYTSLRGIQRPRKRDYFLFLKDTSSAGHEQERGRPIFSNVSVIDYKQKNSSTQNNANPTIQPTTDHPKYSVSHDTTTRSLETKANRMASAMHYLITIIGLPQLITCLAAKEPVHNFYSRRSLNAKNQRQRHLSEIGAECSLYSKCAHLADDCCPTRDGFMLVSNGH
jgi:hypothetical protein